MGQKFALKDKLSGGLVDAGIPEPHGSDMLHALVEAANETDRVAAFSGVLTDFGVTGNGDVADILDRITHTHHIQTTSRTL